MSGTNLQRFETEIKRLCGLGHRLQLALLIKAHGMNTVKQALKSDAEELKNLDALPHFEQGYESWYSESLAVIRQLLPDRLLDFRGHYEIPKNRKDITFASYRIQDALNGLQVTKSHGNEIVVDDKAAVPRLKQQIAILQATQRRLSSSLFDIKQLVQADLFDREIDVARELYRSKFHRAAGAIAGVVLEKHLRQVADDHKISVKKKHPGIADLSQLLRENDVIDMPTWRHIALLSDIRNLAAHSKGQEPTADQVSDLIEGANKMLRTVH